MVKYTDNVDQLMTLIVKGIEEVKGKDIVILDLRSIENTIFDYFVICTGSSNTHVNAIVNSLQKTVSKEIKVKSWHIEGYNNAEWVLIDYITIVVHVFQKQIRSFYGIESLWGDAQMVSITTH